ncbi:MAG: hypothetical protein COT17_00585 [Elusimicrobia bacterium CG08_land_8_20_14_0_20_51_18]|nr:MAG: hypothetical protein COT17_00585 [Elusimicrobia bacterium CG08_land_8_20_14_0_20_51_18]
MKKILILSAILGLMSFRVQAQTGTKAPAKTGTVKTSSQVKKKPAITPAGGAVTDKSGKKEAPAEKSVFDTALEQIKSQDPQIRRLGAGALVAARDPKAAPHLENLLADGDEGVRIAAIDGLGVLRSESSVEKLLKMLAEEKSALVRQSCVIALSYMGGLKNPENLISAAMKDPDLSVRYAAIRTLGSLKINQAEGELIKALKEDDPDLKRAVISSLGAIRSVKAVDQLKNYLTNENVNIRQEAIKALGSIGDASAIENIKARLSESNPEIQLEAALALAKLGNASGLETAYKHIDSREYVLQQQALTVLSIAGDAKSLELLDKKIKETKNESVKPVMEFTRQRIKARLKLGKGK